MAFIPFHEQYFEKLSEEALTYIHLHADSPIITMDYSIISTLAVTRREVRSAITNDYSKNILPIMGMCAIIEQLGEAYKRIDLPVYPHTKASSFKKALYYFNNQSVDNDFAKALYGLRNGIVHNASFYSPGKNTQPHYIFAYTDSLQNVITPSTSPWDANFNNIHTDYFTMVNPNALLELIEDCLNTVKQASAAGNLKIALSGGKNELIFRYFKWKRLS